MGGLSFFEEKGGEVDGVGARLRDEIEEERVGKLIKLENN